MKSFYALTMENASLVQSHKLKLNQPTQQQGPQPYSNPYTGGQVTEGFSKGRWVWAGLGSSSGTGVNSCLRWKQNQLSFGQWFSTTLTVLVLGVKTGTKAQTWEMPEDTGSQSAVLDQHRHYRELVRNAHLSTPSPDLLNQLWGAARRCVTMPCRWFSCMWEPFLQHWGAVPFQRKSETVLRPMSRKQTPGDPHFIWKVNIILSSRWVALLILTWQ